MGLIGNEIMGRNSEDARLDDDQTDFKTGICNYYNALQQPLQKLS